MKQRKMTPATIAPFATTRTESQIRWLFWAVIALGVLYTAYATATLQGLYSDGANYLMEMMLHGNFVIIEPGRIVVQLLQQAPTVILIRSNINNIQVLSEVHTATMLSLPLLLLLACYRVLPEPSKAFVAFPLFIYLAGVFSTLFAAIGEGSIATMYFWMILLMVLFYATTPARQFFTAVTALPLPLLAEVLAFLGPLLIVAATIRLKQLERRSSDRLFAWFCVVYFTASTLWQFKMIVAPFSFKLQARDNVMQQMLALKFLINGTQINFPAILGVVAGLLLITIVWRSARAGEVPRLADYRWAIVVFAVCSVIGIFWPFLTGNFVSAKRLFQARYYPGILSFPVALSLLWAICRPRLFAYLTSPPTLAVLGVLAIGTVGWNVGATWHWQRFLSGFRSVLAGPCHGLISDHDMRSAFPEADARTPKMFASPWTNPVLSVLQSPRGRVSTIVAARAGDGYTFDPTVPNELPKIRGVDYGPYLAAREKQRVASPQPGRDFPCVGG